MKLRVVNLPRAQQDLAEVHDFIAEVQQQPIVAARRLDGIQAAIEGLAAHPRRGKPIPEQDLLPDGVRVYEILFHRHRILYTLVPGRVQIVHIRRGTRRSLGPGEI
ncbi:MAG: type II toxin-antitoxin system RelE/ParE family toxin [Planctomycetes bacterium]|nr:type II toxin-antitoxin system RelE/ParE family toxin [Planctomycetota bacterium]